LVSFAFCVPQYFSIMTGSNSIYINGPATKIAIAPNTRTTTLNIGEMNSNDISITASNKLGQISMITRNTSTTGTIVMAGAFASQSGSYVSVTCPADPICKIAA
jgi:hypothetical protein